MANLWDSLDEQQRKQIARQAIVGSENTPGNLSRAMEQLANNPNLVERLATEACINESDGTLNDTVPDENMDQDNPNDIERTVNESLAGETDMQETGQVTQDIPPPMKGETMDLYIQRLMQMTESGEQSVY